MKKIIISLLCLAYASFTYATPDKFTEVKNRVLSNGQTIVQALNSYHYCDKKEWGTYDNNVIFYLP